MGPHAEIFAERQNYGRRIAIYMAHRTESGLKAAAPTVFEPAEDGDVRAPWVSLTPHDAQTLMDELWRCGLRPTEGTGSAGSLAATERHLKDMQAIAFQLLPSTTKKEGT